jgi:undecaprenyl-diphosphatase
MPEWVNVIIQGIVEGFTEFLPISSTGHLILSSQFLQMDTPAGVFEIFIQLGAVIAVLLFYWSDIWQQIREVQHKPQIQQFWLGIFIAFLPAATIGFLLNDWINDVLFQPYFVAIGLIIGGILFLVAENFLIIPEDNSSSIDAQPPSLKQAFFIGCWQVLALLPGMSRSGMCIIGTLVTGLDRKRATQFSFYLAIPTLGMATIYTLLKNLAILSSNDLLMLFLGMIVSGIVAWFSIAWLLRFVSSHNFIPFAYYRIIFGIIILIILYL